MKILILYNIATEARIGLPKDLDCEREISIIVPLVTKALVNYGHDVQILKTDLNLWEELKSRRKEIDLVLNLAEAFGGANTDEALVPSMLEALQIPFSGASSRNMHFTLDKEKTKIYLSNFDISVPKHQLFRDPNEILSTKLQFPIIVKPVRTEASIGIHRDNVVADKSALFLKIKEMIKIYRQPVLIEEFIIGREISVGVMGNYEDLEVMPPLEFLFPDSESSLEKFRSYEYKWSGKKEVMVKAELEKTICDEIIAISKRAFKLCECQDYARFDFRVDMKGTPFLLEVNHNPGIGPNTHGLNNTLTMMASFAGLTFEKFIEKIIKISSVRNRE